MAPWENRGAVEMELRSEPHDPANTFGGTNRNAGTDWARRSALAAGFCLDPGYSIKRGQSKNHKSNASGDDTRE